MGLLDLMEGLVAADVQVVLVGGMAARAHGAQRVTDDVDVCYRTGYRNERKLVALLRSWDARPRELIPGRSFRLTRAHLAEHDTVRLRTTHGFLDIMRVVPGIGPYEDALAHCDTLTLPSGSTLPLLNLDKLIRAKEHANRGKDQEALRELRALRALRLQRQVEQE